MRGKPKQGDAPAPRKAKAPRQQNLFNRAMLKRMFLQRAAALRPAWGPNRFSEDNYAKIEADFRNYVDRQIMAQPSKGKTIKL